MSESGLPGRGGEFFALLEELRVFRAGPLAGDPSNRALARAAGVSPTTIGDWLRGERFAQDIGKVLAVVRMMRITAVRRGVAIPGSGPAGLLAEDRWRGAYQQEAQRRAGVVSDVVEQAQAVWALAGPRVRVSEADLRLLGVHAAISLRGVPDRVPPEYVPRDVDAAEFGVRVKVEAAAQRGGFVLLVGGSSVGKTRTAAEAVKALLPDWWLVYPADPAKVGALAQAPPQTVVWLDGLQRYLEGEQGLTTAVVRALLTARPPVVIIGTLWPDRYNAYTAVPAPGAADPHAQEREVLGLAAVIHIDPEFSHAEQDRARAAAARDRRLAVALEAAGYGLTQTLAAAPQLVARWENAKTIAPYAWAVLTAALDTARLGARTPLSSDLLRAAAPGYCTSQQQAEAPDNWFEQALAYATEKLHGAAAALRPAGAGMGQIAGYIPADYLIQHATRERRYDRLPASTWEAVLSYVPDADDAARLADSARNRLLYRYAIPLYLHAGDAGDERSARQLAELLADCGDLDGLRARADAGDEHAAWRLAELLADCGDLDGLRARADAGDEHAALRLAKLLVGRGGQNTKPLPPILTDPWIFSSRRSHLFLKHGHLDRLRKQAGAAGDERLAKLLVGRDDLEELRTRADAGNTAAAWRLAELLAIREDLDGLRARADAGDRHAAGRLAELLAERGDLDGTALILRTLADAGDGEAAWQLAELLAIREDLDGLRARADAGDRYAAGRLAELLAKRGDLDGLRARADAGDRHAAGRLAELLAKRGDLDGLRARADAGDRHAAGRLAELLANLLIEQGRSEEAKRLRRFGFNPDGSIASA